MKDIFCARCQQVTPHKGSVDQNGEFLFECQNTQVDTEGNETLCGRFVKFHKNVTPQEFEALLDAHQEQNVGQVSLEGQEKRLQELLGITPTVSEES